MSLSRVVAVLICSCGERRDIELAADVADDFFPVGEPYLTLKSLGSAKIWHCYGCGEFTLVGCE